MDKIKVNDMSFNLSAERPYKLHVRGTKYSLFKRRNNRWDNILHQVMDKFLNRTDRQVHEEVCLDMSDLTLEQIGVIAGFLDAVFDRANLNSITGAEILPLEDKQA